jgi:beta-glucosidase
MLGRVLQLVLSGAVVAAGVVSAQIPPRPRPDRLQSRIAQLTLEQKFWQLFMLPGTPADSSQDYSDGVFGLQVPAATDARADAERLNEVQRWFLERSRPAIPIIPFEEAVHGLRRPGATMFPAAIALAATWDTVLMERVATAIARETRSRGIRQVLSPVVNLGNDPRWGRVEETYGEDPFLVSAMTSAYVRAFTRAGVITTPKHFVANVGDGGRDSWPIALDERALSELHFPPFQAAIEAGALSVMTAYNSVGGEPATQNPWLLTEILRKRWGFEGFVISDASATGGATVLHRTAPNTPVAAGNAFQAGLDVVFQSAWREYAPYLRAFRQGLVPAAVVDSALSRVLTAKRRLGLFEAPYADPDSAEYWNGHADHLALAREAAARAIVLLRNRNHRLPLSSSTGSIALIGPDATEARLGGYSAAGVSPVSILDGLRERLGEAVQYAAGPGRSTGTGEPIPTGHLDLTTAFFDNPKLEGTPRTTRTDSLLDVRWTFNAPVLGLGTEWYSVRWSGTLRIGSDSIVRLGVEGTDGWRLYLDGTLVLDRWHKQSAGTHLVEVLLTPGSVHELTLEYYETTGNANLRLIWERGSARAASDARFQDAVDLAAESEVALVVAGIEEGEFRDRAFLGLPGRQEDLIRAVAATGTPTVVILIGGSAITMPWLEEVDAVLMAWYPGEAGGRAIADVLLGDVSPAGRLPISFPIAEGQLPLVYNHKPTGRGEDYVDLTGRPLFPFGFGLSYTTFEYSGVRVSPDTMAVHDTATVRIRVRNSGERAGDEVVQLYIRDVLASLARPVITLRGFARIHLGPGEERDVTFRLGPAELSLLDRDLRRVVEPGVFRIYVGASSRDIRARGELVVR